MFVIKFLVTHVNNTAHEIFNDIYDPRESKILGIVGIFGILGVLRILGIMGILGIISENVAKRWIRDRV